jgi:hypothetical protein
MIMENISDHHIIKDQIDMIIINQDNLDIHQKMIEKMIIILMTEIFIIIKEINKAIIVKHIQGKMI